MTLALAIPLLAGAGLRGQGADGFRSYPKHRAPRGALHALLEPVRARLAAALVRLRLEPQRLLEHVEGALLETRSLGSAEDPELGATRAELHRVRGALRLALGGRARDPAQARRGRADLQEAARIYAHLLATAPEWRFEALIGQGHCLAELGKRVEALKRFGLAAQVDPQHELPYLERARIYRESGDAEQARLEIRAGLERLPGEIHLELELLALDLLAGRDCHERLAPFLSAARRSAEPALRARVAALALQQGVLLARAERTGKARTATASNLLRQATELDPSSGDAWFFLASDLARRRDLLAAVGAYDRALEEGTRYAGEARLEQAKLVAVVYGALLEGDRPRAYRLMRRALEMHEQLLAEGIHVSGLQRRLMGCFAEVREKAAKALAADRHEEALALYGEALQIDPDNAFLRGYQGLCLEELGRAEEARAAYRQGVAAALASDQDAWWPFLALEGEARRNGSGAEAERLARSYLEHFPAGARAEYFRERYARIAADLKRKKDEKKKKP